jgi:hypothetical protein
MTEQEAKTKWCPMVRHVGPKAPLDSTPPDAVHNNGAYCKGSQCMMWRWEPHRLGDNPTITVHSDGRSTSDDPKPMSGGCGLPGWI